MDIQLYSDKVTVEHEANQVNVTLENVDVSLLVGQFNTQVLLEALAEDNYADIVKFVSRGKDDE